MFLGTSAFGQQAVIYVASLFLKFTKKEIAGCKANGFRKKTVINKRILNSMLQDPIFDKIIKLARTIMVIKRRLAF